MGSRIVPIVAQMEATVWLA